jgi:small subunit ribosomal protein S8
MANVTDPIADMLTRIRNAQLARHAQVVLPGSKLKLAIAQILSDLGYVAEVRWADEGPQGKIEIDLKYDRDDQPMIRNLKRISKPSRRVYVGAKEIEPVLNGLGVAILSTSKGVITDKDARAANIGGELLCTVY